MIRTTPIPKKKKANAKETKKAKAKGKGTGKRGRPTKFSPEKQRQVLLLIQEGWLDAKICNLVGVSNVTLCAWKNKNPDFLKAIKKGKQEVDKPVKVAIQESATGYYRKSEETIFRDEDGNITGSVEKSRYYPPDPTLAIFYICNRDPDNWKRNLDKRNTPDDNTELWKQLGLDVTPQINKLTDGESK